MNHIARESASAIIGHPAEEIIAPTKGPISQFFAMVSKALMDAAWAENRRYDRIAKRQKKHAAYIEAGLNGERAMARRQRQIAAGSLRRENGLQIT
jgi:hypothetical protein